MTNMTTNTNPNTNTTIVINDYTFDLSPVEDSHGPHYVYDERFLISPYTELIITYKGKTTIVHNKLLLLQPTRAGDNCVYLVLANDLKVSLRGIHVVTPDFIEKLSNDLKRTVTNKLGWYACSFCEVLEGESTG